MSEAIRKAANAIAVHWTVALRGMLYFLAVFLTIIGEKLSPIFFEDKWPSGPYTVGGCIVATAAGLMAVRAFLDGSAQRHSDALASKGGTDFFVRKQPQDQPKKDTDT